MQSNIFELIDLLVKMSGSNSNIDELKADLTDTTLNIEEVQNKLESLEQEMSDEKYFDASNEIVDRNIKISLTKKIQKLTKIKNDIDKELEDVKAEENLLHAQLMDVSNSIKEAENYCSTISDNEEQTDAYSEMLDKEFARLEKLKENKTEIESKYEKVQKKAEYLAISSSEISDKIAKENERLIDVENSLSNIKSYVDTDAKEADEERFLEVKTSLDKLYEHKNNILEDPVYLAYLVKESIANDEKDKVEENFKHLLDIVRNIPYMGLENDEIQVEMQKLSDELTKYDSEISQKVYQTLDSEFINERISYLDEFIKKAKDRLRDLEDRKKLVVTENDLLSSKITRAESQIGIIEASLVDYENYDYSENEIPKTVIQAANNKLIDEKTNISSIAEKYRYDLLANLSKIKEIDKNIERLNSDITLKESEYDELSKLLSLNTTSKNILEEEKDKLALEKINQKIVALKNREQFTKSLSEISDEFEMLNSSLEFVDRKSRVSRGDAFTLEELNEEPKSLDEIISNDNKELKSEEAPQSVSEPVNKVESVLPPVLDNEIKPIEEITEESKENKEKLRVVEVTPLTDDVSEPKEEENYMINDFQDDDYVDINEAISSMEDN